VERVPKGVVGILAPWNYPVNLALGPVAPALAAGNRVLLKPSELTPTVSKVMAEAVRTHFTAEEVAVVEGGPGVAQAVTRLPLDHLFFTGSTAVGKQVARAAAEHLVPITLELGGKSPVLIHPSYPIAKAAERVAVGKLFNGGQTCIAPDYALVPEGKEVVFADAFKAAAHRLWPRGPSTSMVNEKGLQRMRAPFGGIGNSGMGQYHGRYGFETFSHPKGVLVSHPLSVAREFYVQRSAKLVGQAVDLISGRLGRFIR
jgi:acyl-CoA reductase-like NAD-dependent aldehyde dehydrogenase